MDQHFCYMNLLSFYHMGPEPNDLEHYQKNPKDYFWLGQVFHDRKEKLSSPIWRKSILSTNNIYYTGYHFPGACLSKKRNFEEIVGYEEAIRVEDNDLAMLHFRYKGKPLQQKSFFVTNVTVTSEYVQNGFFKDVLQSLKRKGIERKIFELCNII